MGRVAQTDLMPDFTGRSLDGDRYRLMEYLGAGAYGKVYRAIDLSSPSSPPKVYAIKCMNKHGAGTHAELLQQREFAHHKHVSGHPNIVPFHRSWQDALHVYVVLGLCSGGDLFGAITEKRLFHKNSKLIKASFVQLVDAVQHCHNLGVYHRDIKPENVLCAEDGTDIRLADFGLSTTSKTSRDFGCGSSYYMSPDCIGRPPIKGSRCPDYSTPENDVWALGVILTNMITGRNPWRLATTQDDCFAAYTMDRNFLKRVLPISSAVNNILKKIFSPQSTRRISLAKLRNEVLDIRAFYDYEEEFLIEVARPLSIPNASSPTSERHASSTGDTTDDSVEDFVVVVSSDPEQGPLAGSPNTPPPRPTNPIVAQHFTLVESDDTDPVPSASSSSSGPDSAGPITPETHPVVDDPAVNIPDMSGDGLGPPADLAALQPLHIAKERVVSPHKSRKPADILRSAVQRIKILSKAEATS